MSSSWTNPATTSSPDSEQADANGSLRRNAISLPGATAMSIALIAPAAGMAFLPQIVAAHAGSTVPFSFLLATVGAVCVAYTVSVFARKFSSAGSFYTFNAKGLGRPAGFFSGWLLFAGYLVFFPQNMLAFGYTLSSVLSEHAHIVIAWWIFATAATSLVAGLGVIGLGLSMRVDLTVIFFEVAVLLGLAAVVILDGGRSGNTTAVFNPAHASAGLSGLAFGLIFALGAITGFESSATVAEETENPKDNIPRAMLGSVIGTGLFFILITYALAIGFGPGHSGEFANTALPLDTLATRYLGSGYAVAIDVVVALSAFAVSIAAGNGAVRVIFAMAREHALPSRLAYTHPRRHTPVIAVLTVAAVSLALTLGLGAAVGPYPNAYSYLGAFGSLPIAFLYVTVCISLIAYFVRTRDPEFHFAKHVLVPIVGIVVAALPIYGSLHPLPMGAFLTVDILLVAYAALGLGLTVFLVRRRPDVVERIGTIMASGSD
jgi:amino acid transporter